MQGRITEAQLPIAEETFPGISEMYENLSEKPATFLQLVWIYENAKRAEKKAGRRRRRGRPNGN